MLVIGKKIYRNMQEQVAFNTEEIEKIQKYLDGLSIDDKLVVVDSLSGTLSPEEIEIVKKPLAFISDGTTVYVKTTKDLSNRLIFRAIDIVSETVSATYIRLLLVGIYVDISTGAFGSAPTNIIETYNKTQIDSIIVANMAQKASLSGADFTGPITAPSIIENMINYTFIKASSIPSLTFEYVYAGIVKNGNKLTLVLSLNLTRLDTVPTSQTIGLFTVPSEVANKLFTTQISSGNYLSLLKARCWESENTDPIDITTMILKETTNIRINMKVGGLNSLNLNTKYNVRIEATFLLGENLAS